jgi:hypothetical protein
MNEYTFVRFQKSNRKGKKYDAVLKNKKTKRETRIPFGQLGYQHYRDSTGLGIYSNLNHNDDKRRKSYKARHSVYIKSSMYSAGYFSMKYLW